MASDPRKELDEAAREWVSAAESAMDPLSGTLAEKEELRCKRAFQKISDAVAARLAAAEAVVEAARADTVCFDHADNCCADECSRCRDCARARIDLAAALAAYDKARGPR